MERVKESETNRSLFVAIFLARLRSGEREDAAPDIQQFAGDGYAGFPVGSGRHLDVAVPPRCGDDLQRGEPL